MNREVFARAWMEYAKQQKNLLATPGKGLKEFTVKRSKWLRNLPSHEASGLLINGKKCCLGFLATTCGYTDEQIARCSYPSGLIDTSTGLIDTSKIPDFVLNEQDDFAEANDEPGPDKVRERTLTKMFAKHGVKVNFVD